MGKGRSKGGSILLVEDSPTHTRIYSEILEASGFSVASVDTGRKGLEALSERMPDMVLLDLSLPDMEGLDVLRELDARGRSAPVIVITGNGSVRAAVEAMRLGAMDFLMKPCSAEKLESSIVAALDRRRTSTATSPGKSARHDGDRRGPSGFLGNSPAMLNVFALIENAAQSSASVFITGESGTGKELCAQAIHNSSPRRNGPFVPLNCAAIPRELMESEVFGHRKGAFTGAHADHEGAASLADGGTLFLDELCEMDLDLQAKLLRFIQTGAYKRVGDAKERTVDIRFVCATNRDPMEEVRSGRFREDLYYRLHVVPIHMPPLRDRGDDLVLLAERFLIDFAAIERKPFRRFDMGAEAAIRRHRWPGNVRELENAIRRAVVLHNAEVVTADMLPFGAMPASATEGNGPAPASGPLSRPSRDQLYDILIRPLDELDIMAIDAALERFGGNVTRAARALDISTSTIYRKKQAWDERQRG